MNTNNGALYFGAGIDRTQWRRDIDAMRRDILGLSQATTRETRNMDSSFKNLSLGIAGAFSVSTIKSFVMELINVRGEFQKTEIAFTTMLGNAEQAKGLMGQMVDLAEKTPFSLQDVSAGAKQLLAFQIPASEVVDTLTRMGNIAAGLGVPLSRINLVYGQVKAKGKLMGDDLRQFTEAGIPMVAELAKKFGKTTSEISAMVSAGKIGFKDVQDVLFSMTNQGGMFYNLMEKQSKSLSGQVANLGDAWDQMLNKIGESNEGMLSDGIQGLTYLVEHYKDVIQIISTLISAYGTYRAVLITVNALQRLQIWTEGTIAAIRFAQGISGMTRAQLLFNAAANANPYVLLASGIAAVVAALVYLRTGNFEAKEETKKLTSAMEYQKAVSDSIATAYKNKSEQLVGAIEKEIIVLKSSYSTAEMRKKAYENLIKLNKSFTGTVDGEYKATQRLSDAYRTLVGRLKELSIAKGKAALLEELSKKKAQADLDLVFKEEDYERQRIENIRKRADNAKKLGSLPKSSMYYEVMVEKDIDYSAYNPVKDARKTKDEINKQFTRLADDVTKGIADATKKNDKELKNAWNNVGEEVLSDGPKRGTKKWYEDEIKRMEDANDNLQVTSKEYLDNLAKIKEYRKKISPESDKKEGRQLAEIIPLGSIKELQRRANLLKEAMDTAVNGIVKLRKVDKYGNDKDKQGNPYFTGETITLESAVKLYEEYDAKIKALQLRNFQERIDESERQWNNYYKTAEYYGKESADAQYKDLFNGAKNYLDYLEKQEQALQKLSEKSILTSQQKQDLIFVRDKINALKGLDTPFENVKKGIENGIKSIPSLTEQLEFIEKLKSVNKIVNSNNPGKFYENDKYYKELSDGLIQQQQDQYIQFEKEHLNFEQRKTEITQRYENIRLRIQQSNDSDIEKARKTEEANKDEAKEISSMSVELFQKTDLWVKAFGDLEKVGPKTIRKMRDEFKKFIDSDAAKALKPEDLKTVQDAYSKLDDTVRAKNPFAAIGISIKKYAEEKKKLAEAEKKYGKNSQQYKEQLDSTNNALGQIFTTSQGAANATIDFAGQMGAALGLLSQEAQQTLKDVQQLFDGIVNAVTGYVSGDYGKMAGGIVQMATSLTKLMNGDADRNKSIQQWGIEIDKLKSLYEQLNKTIEKTAGEAQLKMQRDLIANLKQQQELLIKMRRIENEKKNSDTDKIASYSQQIEDINNKISDLVDEFKSKVTTIEFKDLAQKMADALVDAFGKGEDAANSFDKVVDDVMKNAVQNALKMKFLDEAAQNMVNELYGAMGFGNGDTTDLQNQLKKAQDRLKYLDNLINNGSPLSAEYLKAKFEKEELEKLIASLQQQVASSNIAGGFDGLTKEERDKIKAMGEDAMKKYMEALKQYQDLFGQSAENAQGLKGDIKGITEKTAGALEGQINAIRIMQAEALKHQKNGFEVMRSQLFVQVQIEQNTRPIEAMYKEIKDLNSKIKPGLAGIP